MAWKTLTRAEQLAAHLGVPTSSLQTARRQCRTIYIKRRELIKGKMRDLCHPPRRSVLRAVQDAVKEKCLKTLPLGSAIYGYRSGCHNISCSEVVAGFRYVGKIDIANFHPSITPDLVNKTLRRLGVSVQMCRIITQLVTHKGQVPQGAPTSNHIANLVVDLVLSDEVLSFCRARGVHVANFGDDTAFAGADQRAVDECIQHATAVFLRYGLVANAKSTRAEHVGAARKFVGVSTARAKPDLTRKKFRQYRADIRCAITAERLSVSVVTKPKTMRSFGSRIGYVERLNPRKAKTLSKLLAQLRAAINRKRPGRAGRERHDASESALSTVISAS